MRHSLLIDYPEIAKQWDYNKNGTLSPDSVSKGSTKKVWWICNKNHSYQSRIDHRTIMHSGCPYCAGKLPIKGENDLATLYPDIAKEWDYEKNLSSPEEFLSQSNKVVAWKCSYCGYSYSKPIIARTKSMVGCPVCTKEKGTSFQEQSILFYLKMKLDIRNRFKYYNKEIDLFIPSLNTGIEYNGRFYHANRIDKDKKKYDFIKSKGVRLIVVDEGKDNLVNGDHIIIRSSPSGFIRHQDLEWCIRIIFCKLNIPCPDVDLDRDQITIKEQYIISRKPDNFAVKYPGLAKEWDNERNGTLKPENFTCGSNHRAFFDCPVCATVYRRSIASRVNGSGCPVCSGKQVKKGYNDLSTTHPFLVEEWSSRNNLKPDEVTYGSDKKVWWHCKTCNQEWTASISSRSIGRVGCPVCAGKVVLPGYNDLESLYPNISEEWDRNKNHGILPSQVTSGSNRQFWWKCKQCGHEWKTTVSNRVRGRGCPNCSRIAAIDARNRTIIAKKGSLAGSYPEIASQWDYGRNEKITPDKVSAGSDLKVWWVCPVCNNNWEAAISSRTINGNGCPECGKKKCVISSHKNRIKKRGSLAELRPDLAMQWDYEFNAPLTPNDVTTGSKKKVGWICPNGHRWVAVVYSRKKAGCPFCAGRKQ